MLRENLSLRKKRIKKLKTPILEKCPQKKGSCLKVFIASPRKPNSAARRVAKVILHSNKRTTIAYCPGIGHSLQKHSTVLIRGGGAKDLPGVNYKMLRGKLDLKLVHGRMNGRSKYGT
jgi:small subunit ribosomal protein S12